jgi:hypothetical protein
VLPANFKKSRRFKELKFMGGSLKFFYFIFSGRLLNCRVPLLPDISFDCIDLLRSLLLEKNTFDTFK